MFMKTDRKRKIIAISEAPAGNPSKLKVIVANDTPLTFIIDTEKGTAKNLLTKETLSVRVYEAMKAERIFQRKLVEIRIVRN
jgi:hypothetical protein